MKTYEWKTARGANVKIEVSQSHREMTSDGFEITRVGVKLESFTVNGTEYRGQVDYRDGKDYIIFKVNGQQAGVEIPEEIYDDMMAETREREAAAREVNEQYYREQAILDRANRGTY